MESATFQHEPLFPLQKFDNLLPLSTFLSQSAVASSTLHLGDCLRTVVTGQLCSEVLDILTHLHELSVFLNDIKLDELPWNASYPDRVYLVEYRIVTLLARTRAIYPEIYSVLIHTALLYIYTNLRQTPVGGAVRGRLSTRLKSMLERVDLTLLMDLFPKEMLWSFFIGAFASSGTSQDQWFLLNLKFICTASRLTTWEEVLVHIRCLPMLEATCMRGCRKIWEQDILI